MSYGVALAAGLGAVWLGAGALAGGLLFWLGGAALTLALGAVPGLNAPFIRPERAPETEAEEEEALAEMLRSWEEDRLADRAEAARARRRESG